MDHVNIRIADIVINVDFVKKADLHASGDHVYADDVIENILTCIDLFSLTSWTITVSAKALEAILACVVSDSGEGFCAGQYELAAKVLEQCPTECRPIP